MVGKKGREEQGDPGKPLGSAGLLKQVMADHFNGIREAAEGGKGKVAWCTSVGPAELLYALGFKVYFPENHGAILGASRASMDYIPTATAHGYSPEVCSYLTSDIGAYLKGETPLQKQYGFKSVPRPDVLVYNTNQCRDVLDWFQFFGREFKAPVLGISSPHPVPEVEAAHVKAVEEQMRALVGPLERIAGRRLEMKDLRKSVELSRDACLEWKGVLGTAAGRPSPLTFFDGTVHMGPIVVMRGTQPALDYYKALRKELDDRVRDGVAAVEGERFRLYWDGMPMWGRLRAHSNLFARFKACVVASTYCNSWALDKLDPARPFESMAEAYTDLFINRTEAIKEQYLLDMVKAFGVDGIIFHDSKTCPNNSNARYGMPRRLEKWFDLPTLVVQGDLCDMRLVSDVQIETAIEAFIESLEARGPIK